MHEHDREPVPGLPQELPQGEKLLWQGRANASSVANGSFHLRKLAGYFAALLVVRTILQIGEGVAIPAILSSLLWLSVLAAVALGIVTWFARRSAAASMYTITDRRIVIRCGIAVPVTVNLPFKMIESLDLREHADGTGDVSVGLERSGRASFVLLFPMVKPFRWLNVHPVMRGVENAKDVCTVLSTALADFADREATPVAQTEAARKRENDVSPKPPRRLHLPLVATASLVVISLVSVSFYQLGKTREEVQLEPAVAAIDVFFQDADDGSVIVVAADNGLVIDTLAPETNGFMRGALRSLVRERRQSNIGSEIPFSVRRTVSGGIQLTDPATNRVIDLRAFGPTNAGAFTRLLDLASASDAVNTAQHLATQSGVTAVASNQQEKNQ